MRILSSDARDTDTVTPTLALIAYKPLMCDKDD